MRRDTYAVKELVELSQGKNRGINPTPDDLSNWLDECESVSHFMQGSTMGGVVSVSPSGEVGFVCRPDISCSTAKSMLSYLRKLRGPLWAIVQSDNHSVVKSAARMGFILIGGTNTTLTLWRY